MSALVHKRTLKRLHPMSALPPKADIPGISGTSPLSTLRAPIPPSSKPPPSQTKMNPS
jgi:hypothetical protein